MSVFLGDICEDAENSGCLVACPLCGMASGRKHEAKHSTLCEAVRDLHRRVAALEDREWEPE